MVPTEGTTCTEDTRKPVVLRQKRQKAPAAKAEIHEKGKQRKILHSLRGPGWVFWTLS